MKKILVLHTGGTIAMVQEENGTVIPTARNPLSDTERYFAPHIRLYTENIFNLPSPHITLHEMLLLQQRIVAAAAEGIDGVVITHGTDTLEETAYFLDITLEKNITVVLTGAMRSSNEIGSDGLYNFINAVHTAAEESSREQGVLVVMNDEIHAAQFVTKTHTTNVDTFRTPTFGPVGIISKGEVYYMKEVVSQETASIDSVEGTVHLIRAYAGMDGHIFRCINSPSTNGVIVEAFGAGNLPPSTVPALQELLAAGIPVALVSRCSNGIAQDIYDYPGGGVGLKEMGVWFVKGVSGTKARIRMVVGLNAGYSGTALKAFVTQ